MSGRNMRAPRAERERGSADRRMMPAALAVWATLLARHAVGEHWDVAVMTAMGVSLAAGVAVLLLTRGGPDARPRKAAPRIGPQCLWHAAVLLAAVGCATVAGGLSDLAESRDPLIGLLGSGESGVVTVTAVATTPVMSSERREADCQIDMRVRTVWSRDVGSPSNATVRAFAEDDACRWRQGAAYRVSGTLKAARFGSATAWLDVDRDDDVRETSPPPGWRAMGTRMQEAFFAQTDRLGDQGRVLVPGLTIGVLGQDVHRQETEGASPVDDTYAGALEEDFKRSGIMHPMAVSGSHFVLAAELVRRCCARLLAPRWFAAVGVIGAYAVLVALVYPSDSVLRAAAMGMVGVAGLFLGRRSQALSSLNWTVIAILLIRPELSGSYGFALSCAAVYGIVLFDAAVAGFLEGLMPTTLARAVSVTVCAQIPTLPIQVMMNPQVPLLAVPANVVTSPVVGMTTLVGLAALLVSWALPGLGHGLVLLASVGTAVLERCATLLGSMPSGTLVWPDGVAGAIAMTAAELACAAAVAATMHAMRILRRDDAADAGIPDGAATGTPYRPTPMSRWTTWWRETCAMLFDVQH
ncbi:ComEC/Rec2 family competence protein [Bifidobacterium sp. 82T24]|uniref:ComEC/Rec2 family competence protein n=1 Tax=Bifidobacterium pluvialisilvae TaxID=2834436 RepID=UPI001C58614D|nr:ComEC/Rec2 family competence protein [Bifidobacterium pluvialisilvae]MBW3087810.1 ComEC/Rec2 family competence protein [Bifidobacterium pluvialisilvae]